MTSSNMTKNTTPIADLICPCCGKLLQLQMIESESGLEFRLFHYMPEISYVEIQEHDLEFGTKEGGEEDGQC